MTDSPQHAADALIGALDGAAATDTCALRDVRRRSSREWRALPAAFLLAAASAVARRRGYRWIAYELIRGNARAFSVLDDARIAALAVGLDSWESVDAFSRTLSGPAWAHGLVSDGLIETWTRSDDRWLRRTALVSTIELGADPRVLPVCDALAADRDDMVVKGLSWALRRLAKHDAGAVRAFLAEREGVLAARVQREVGNKLATGLKNPNRRAGHNR